MRTVLIAAACSVALGVCSSAIAQTRGTSRYVTRLVPELCGGAPCNVSGITFTRGEVRLDPLKQSDLMFTTSIGRVALRAVSPPQTGLQARLSATLSYGPDPNLDCPEANSQVVVNPWATSSLTCIPAGFAFWAPCAGEVRLTSVTAPECADVDVIVENIAAEVYENGFVGDLTHRIARDGLAIGGRSPDCDSGGVGGCP
jgi:hypothetical protein